MISVTNLDSSSWNTVVNNINAKAKEAYFQSDGNLRTVEGGIEKVEKAMEEMYESFNETNIYVNMLCDLINLYKQSRSYGRYATRDSVPSQSASYFNNIIPDRGRKIDY